MRSQPCWSALGLSGNPFENVSPGERLEWVCWPDGLREEMARPQFAIELLGRNKGAGKSTLLHAAIAFLREHERAVEHHYVSPGERRLPAAMFGSSVVALDEADRLGFFTRRALRAFAQRGGSVLVATHEALRIPGARTFDLEALRLRGWIEARFEAHRLPDSSSFSIVEWLPEIERAAGAVSYRILRILYELCEDWARGAPMNRETLDRVLAASAQFE